ncbi:antibiotic biosynthesis monooxygenase family protein [Mesorhizobium sp. KR2-14]|uniref:antibiotic biosynthesis monooxygenase family protein n=1 Tax=Mesorhizobium sp. KR2-14 TaxID=3156610 RepID=UPI0032B5D170
MLQGNTGNDHIYRMDQFAVPAQVRDEFLQRVRQTHELLRKQPGFLQDFMLERSSGEGECNLVTLVEWENEAAVERARSAIRDMHQQIGFNPPEFMARLGVKAAIATYGHLRQ